ncbi:MAG: 4Fe-4S dicluster domain-containing protein [Deltaproteobacteria bacterium]|nr:4Fe-4S dicluster domain-containing protein [Deltaproteobacteria bacterium]
MARKKKYAMFIDTLKCVGCSACVYACKSENQVPEGFCRDWVVQKTEGTFPHLSQLIRSERCQHCENAPCVTNCPTGASYYPGDGTVQVDRNLCTGCKACIAACPYDARYIHPVGFADKCTFCQHRLKEGLQPACVTACPTETLKLVDLMENSSTIEDLVNGRQIVKDKVHAGTKPKLFWLV